MATSDRLGQFWSARAVSLSINCTRSSQRKITHVKTVQNIESSSSQRVHLMFSAVVISGTLSSLHRSRTLLDRVPMKESPTNKLPKNRVEASKANFLPGDVNRDIRRRDRTSPGGIRRLELSVFIVSCASKRTDESVALMFAERGELHHVVESG